MPQLSDPQLEKYVLAGIIDEPPILGDIHISERSFADSKNKKIFNAILKLEAEGEQVDAFNLFLKLEKSLELHAKQITEIDVLPSQAKKAADKLKELAVRRDLILASQKISLAARDDEDLSEVVNMAEQKVLDATQEGLMTADWHSTSELIEIYDEYRKKKAATEGIVGMPTGIEKLDQYTSGLTSSKLTYLGGRPGMGKTFFGINIAINVARQGDNVLFFSIEMDKRDIIERMIANLGRISTDVLRDGLVVEGASETVREKYSSAIAQLNCMNLKINDKAGVTVDDIASITRRAYRQEGVDLVIIDYLQKIRYKRKEGMSTDDSVKEVSGPLAELAKNLDIHVLCLSQLSRQVERRENKRPNNSDLRESGNLEQDADMIWFLYRHSEYEPDYCEDKEIGNIAELKISKNRFGREGTVLLGFEAPMATFREANKVEYARYKAATRGHT